MRASANPVTMKSKNICSKSSFCRPQNRHRISEHSAADCGIIQNMNKVKQIAPIAAAVISGGIMACDEAAQNAAVRASCSPPRYQQSGVTPPDAHLGAGPAQGKSNKTSLVNSLPRTRQCVDVDALSRESANSQKEP